MQSPRVALITGAARRIGAGIARHLHAAGMDVAIHYRRSADDAEQLAAELCSARAGSAIALAADLSQAGACADLIERAAGWRGRLDALVNNASSFYRTPLGEVDEAQWSELIDGNLKAVFFASQAAAPWLRSRRGAIVNLCDVHTERPLPQFSVYTAAKAGIVALTRALALELAPQVRVNAVSPGSFDWPERAIFTAEERRRAEAAIPLARLGNADDVARAVAFLISGNDYITGQVLAVDGGTSLVSR